MSFVGDLLGEPDYRATNNTSVNKDAGMTSGKHLSELDVSKIVA